MMSSACSRHDHPSASAADEGSVDFERKTEFSGPMLRVFLTLRDGIEVSVKTADDAVQTRPGVTPITGTQENNVPDHLESVS